MVKIATEKVFGVSNEQVETYIERPEVDDLFVQGLNRNKHIVIYGASKQGKTSLTNKHLSKDDFVKFNCSYNSEPIDVYKSILRQLDIEFEVSNEEINATETSSSVGVKANVKIPLIASGEASLESTGSSNREDRKTFKMIEYNLGLAQDVVEILSKNSFGKKRIILENFHYLSEETQEKLAIDLRIFEDNNILFIIVGIWRERNRLLQYNGDLADRLIEIPVEPWKKEDLFKIINIGEVLLNVDLTNIKEHLIEACFDSVGVFQELCKESCFAKGVRETSVELVAVLMEDLDFAIKRKLEDYSSRHLRALETFVQQEAKSSDEIPLYMRYYLVRVIFEMPFDLVVEGLKRKHIQEKIQGMHHRPDDVRASDTGYLVKTLVKKQIENNIKPPILDFDQSTNSVKIIDSTFYFFLRNCDREEVLSNIPAPAGL